MVGRGCLSQTDSQYNILVVHNVQRSRSSNVIDLIIVEEPWAPALKNSQARYKDGVLAGCGDYLGRQSLTSNLIEGQRVIRIGYARIIKAFEAFGIKVFLLGGEITKILTLRNIPCIRSASILKGDHLAVPLYERPLVKYLLHGLLAIAILSLLLMKTFGSDRYKMGKTMVGL